MNVPTVSVPDLSRLVAQREIAREILVVRMQFGEELCAERTAAQPHKSERQRNDGSKKPATEFQSD